MAGYVLTPARRAALKRAQIASARKRRGTGRPKAKPTKRGATRIDRKISRVQTRGKKRATRQGKKVINNIYTNADRSEIYTNRKGVKAYQKGVKINAKTDAKVAKLKAKKKKKTARKR